LELRTSQKTVSLAAESLEDRQTWLAKLARVSTSLVLLLWLSYSPTLGLFNEHKN